MKWERLRLRNSMCAQTFAAFQRFSGFEQAHALSRVPTTRLQSSAVALLRDRICPTLCNVALPHAKTECVPCALDVGTSQPCNPLRSCCWDSLGPRATGCVRHVDFTTMRGDAFPVHSVASTNRMICVPTTHVYFVFTNTCGSWRHAGAFLRPTAILHDFFLLTCHSIACWRLA